MGVNRKTSNENNNSLKWETLCTTHDATPNLSHYALEVVSHQQIEQKCQQYAPTT